MILCKSDCMSSVTIYLSHKSRKDAFQISSSNFNTQEKDNI